MRINKHILTIVLAASTVVTAWAVQAKHTPINYTQSDGSTITVTLAGDEWRHGHVTRDGLLVKQNDRGDWCYATATGTSTVIAHEATQRSAAEAQYAASSAITFEHMATPARAKRSISAKGFEEETQVPNTGSPRIPIILVDYQDLKFKNSDPVGAFEEHFNTGDKSAYKYFSDQSFGKFTPRFDILGYVQLADNRGAYGRNDRYGNDTGLGKMVAEACLALGDSIDWSKYDNDGDGQADVVILLYAGTGEAQSGIPEAVWPCQWDLASSDYEQDLPIGNTVISKFAVFNELYGASDESNQIDGIGTFCHEFSHCIGMPDFYATNNMGYYGMGSWSLMDYGNYNDMGRTPAAYTAYERTYMGWMDMEEASPNSIITLNPVEQGGMAYKITNDQEPSGNEYFVIECRKQEGWNSFLASSGLMVTHVYYDDKAWRENTVNNNGQLKRMTTVPADNKQSYYNEEGDLFPYGNNDMLTDESTPPARTYVGTSSIKRLHKPITDITRNDDGSITLKFMYTGLKGDVNGDGEVDVTDVNILINIILGKDSADNYDGRADVTGDGNTDVSDVNSLINIILNKNI